MVIEKRQLWRMVERSLRGRSVARLQIRIFCISASFSVDRFVTSSGYYRGSVEAVIKPIVR